VQTDSSASALVRGDESNCSSGSQLDLNASRPCVGRRRVEELLITRVRRFGRRVGLGPRFRSGPDDEPQLSISSKLSTRPNKGLGLGCRSAVLVEAHGGQYGRVPIRLAARLSIHFTRPSRRLHRALCRRLGSRGRRIMRKYQPVKEITRKRRIGVGYAVASA